MYVCQIRNTWHIVLGLCVYLQSLTFPVTYTLCKELLAAVSIVYTIWDIQVRVIAYGARVQLKHYMYLLQYYISLSTFFFKAFISILSLFCSHRYHLDFTVTIWKICLHVTSHGQSKFIIYVGSEIECYIRYAYAFRQALSDDITLLP